MSVFLGFSLPSSSFFSYKFTLNRHLLSRFYVLGVTWVPVNCCHEVSMWYPSALRSQTPKRSWGAEIYDFFTQAPTTIRESYRYKHTLQWRVVTIWKAFGSLSICSGLDRSKISLLVCEDAAVSGFIFFYTCQHFLNLKLLSLQVLNKEEQNRNMCPEEKSFGGGEGRLPAIQGERF